jgi:hypothetical protein
LAIGLNPQDADAVLPVNVSFKKAEHISAFFEPAGLRSPLAGIAAADLHNRDPRELWLVAGGAEIAGTGVLALASDGRLVLCQMAPWQFDGTKQPNLKRTHRRAAFVVSRLLANLGVSGSPPVLERFASPAGAAAAAKRWLGLYVDIPEEWDDPYRFFRW